MYEPGIFADADAGIHRTDGALDKERPRPYDVEPSCQSG